MNDLRNDDIDESAFVGSNDVAVTFAANELQEYADIGNMEYTCQYCAALHWFAERAEKSKKKNFSIFSKCCLKGKVGIPLFRSPPELLFDLITGVDQRSKHFLANIRIYNSMFAFTSYGGKVQNGLNDGGGPPQFVISGQNYHRTGSLLPMVGEAPKFAQLYIYDTQNEVENRSSHFRGMGGESDVDQSLIRDLLGMIDDSNTLVKSFRMARDFIGMYPAETITLRLFRNRPKDPRVYNLPSVDEVAALIVGDFDSSDCGRDILISDTDGKFQRIHETHTLFLPLQYPLLFLYGEDGYKEDICFREDGNKRVFKKRKRVSLCEFICFRLQERIIEDSLLLRSRRLFQQYLVDCYSMLEAQRLSFIRANQSNIRRDFLSGLEEVVERGDVEPASTGTRIVLPSSFVGGKRYMFNNCQDAMAICRHCGYPDLFITVTCNPKWPEIQRHVRDKGLNAYDRPDIACRVFRIKLYDLMVDLKRGEFFGKVIAGMYTIEFQKRGLPHAHILIWLGAESKLSTPDMIDSVICAELPDPVLYPKLFETVSTYMVHGPCGVSKRSSPCMVNGRCSKFFPKKYVGKTSFDLDGYPIYRRRNTGVSVVKRDIHLDNGYVVPYNAKLLMKYQAHINIEYCNKSNCIKNLFKYINKGVDRVTVSMKNSVDNEEKLAEVDEIQQYYDCRYLSPCESAWRSFKFDIHHHWPAVQRLTFHMPKQQVIVFNDKEPIDGVVSRNKNHHTMFTAWMDANKKFKEGSHLSYTEYPQAYVHDPRGQEWTPRKMGQTIGRINFIPLGCGELHYLRILLNSQCGCRSYEDIRTVNGVVHPTFREVCLALGLLDDDKQFIDGIIECSQLSSGYTVRVFFVGLLLSNSMVKPEKVFEDTWRLLADGILYDRKKLLGCPDLFLDDELLKTLCLVEVDKLLLLNGKSLRDFPTIAFPISNELPTVDNVLLFNELRFDILEMKSKHLEHVIKLNKGQKVVYDEVMDAVNSNSGGFFFVYGYGGTGKTFLWKTLTYRIRLERKVILNVASSGIASLLMPGGRTAHSLFGIPLLLSDDTCCNIRQGSLKAELLKHTSLIIWDEAPMVNRWAFEALDRTLKDIMRFDNLNGVDKPFGGKVVVLGGDFRQTLPIIPKAFRAEIVMATINSSKLWKFCKVLRLNENMRLESGNCAEEVLKLKQFGDWILNVGDGTLGDYNDGECVIEIPLELLVCRKVDPIADIVQATYPDLSTQFFNDQYFADKAILAPTLDIVDCVNEHVLSMSPGNERVYLSSDTIVKVDEDIQIEAKWITTEFLNDIKSSGVPDHKLVLKKGVPVIMLRNVDVASGLCNGTRLIVDHLGDNVIGATIINGNNIGAHVFIGRMNIIPSDVALPVKFQRRQFPICVCFAMTINKSQGQTLSRVGIFLPKPVFSHGQLYVAVSRVKTTDGLKIYVDQNDPSQTKHTKNVVYKEVFKHL